MLAAFGSLCLYLINVYVWFCVCSAFIFLMLLMISKIEFPIAEINFYTRHFLIFFTLGVELGVLLPVFLVRPGNVANLRIYGRLICWTLSLTDQFTFEVRSSEHLSPNQGAIIVSNYQSVFDLVAFLCLSASVLPKLTFSSKQELVAKLPWPLPLLLGVNAQSMDSYKANLLKDKIQLWISSTNQKNRNTSGLEQLKRGPFNLAVHAQVPIIPVVVSPFHFIDAKYYIFAKGHVILKTLAPIPTSGLLKSDVDKLLDRTQVIMQREYQILKNECLHHAIDREWQEERRPVLTIK